MYDAVIVSDFHLGSNICQAKTIERFLTDILEETILTNSLIINGDLFDNLDFRRLPKRHWNVLALIRKLSSRITTHLVVGNHEGHAEIISHLIGTDFLEKHVVTSSNKKYLVMHGHQFDKFLGENPILVTIGDLIYNFLQKIDPSFRLAKIAKMNSKHFLRCSELVEEKAKICAFTHNCDGIICGHVHLAVSKPHDVSYYNCGCWTEIPTHYAAIKDGNVDVIEYQ